MGRQKKLNWSFGIFGGVFLITMFILNAVFTAKTVGNSSEVGTSLPKMEIFLNGTSLDEIYLNGKDVKYEGNEISIKDGNGEQFFVGVQIKGRGNSSWNHDKKPFRIKFSSRTELLGLGKSKKWVLISNNVDNSLMRNDVAFLMNRMLDGDYAMSGKYVELWVDGVDLGVYYVTKNIGIGKDLVRLTDEYGVLVEIDNIYCDTEEDIYMTKSGTCLVLKDTVAADNFAVAMGEFAEEFEKTEALAMEGNYEALKEVIDIESFAEYFLISEITNNPDAFTTSWWLYRDGSDDLIHAGPAWDFDLALGNRNWGEGGMEEFHNPNRPLIKREIESGSEKEQSTAVSKLMYYLLDIPEFRDEVERIYQERLMDKKDEILDYVREQKTYIEEAVMKDAEIWGKSGFDEEVEYLIWWIENRFQMMDVEYGNKMPSLVNEKEI